MNSPEHGRNSDSSPKAPARPYDSPIRRAQTARTRERIVSAGSQLVHELTTWDWSALTFRTVAERAGISERTVFRYFATDRELHEAVMHRLEEEAGVSYDELELAGVADMSARVLTRLRSFAVTDWSSLREHGPNLAAGDQHRIDALRKAVREQTGEWTDTQQRMAAGVLDMLWDVRHFQRFITAWGLDPDQAVRALSWGIEAVVRAIDEGPRPEDP